MLTWMLTWLDNALDRITMYRLALSVLAGLLGVAVILSFFSLVPFSPLALVLSTAFLVLMCWAANTLLARIFRVPANIESATITALILALIIDPARSIDTALFLGWAAILAMASKYVLSINNKHLFNPAAIAVVITSFALGQSASWWIGTGSMLPGVLVGGLLIVRKTRQEAMVGVFVAVALATLGIVSGVQRLALSQELQQALVASPLFFFAAVMLTEPLTAPPTRRLKLLYAAMVGVLFVPQIHIGRLYSTPELALVAGNLFAYLVSPKPRPVLRLKRRHRLARNMVDFVFTPSQRLAFAPGQYIEVTLGHAGADSRGNRRYFTLASSPTEQNVRLGVRFYQNSSSFKRALYALDGRTALLGGPIAGDFTLPNDPTRKLAFIAGGIGITPYRSMLKYLLDTKQPRDIVLLYANRTPDEFVYRDVLNDAETRLGARVFYTVTDAASTPPSWRGLRGRVDEQMLLRTVPDYQERIFYLSGPPAMVRAHEHALRKLGVPRSRIKKDFFAGLA